MKASDRLKHQMQNVQEDGKMLAIREQRQKSQTRTGAGLTQQYPDTEEKRTTIR